MSYDFKRLPTFNRQAKRLAKKYPSLKTDLWILFDSLREELTQEFYRKHWLEVINRQLYDIYAKAVDGQVKNLGSVTA